MKSGVTHQQLLPAYFRATGMLQHGMMWLDQAGNILFANERLTQELGYPKERFEPKTIFQITPHHNMLSWRDLWNELLEKGEILIGTEHIAADGSTLNAELKGVLVEVGEMKLCNTFLQSKSAFESQELFLAKFCMDNASDMIFQAAPDGSILHANHAAAEKLGLSHREILGMKTYELDPTLSADTWQTRWETVKATKKMELLTSRKTPSGESVPCMLSVNHVEFNGKEYNLAFVKDLSAESEWHHLSFYSVNQSDDMIFWLRTDGSFFYFNESLCEKTGYARPEIEWMRLLDFFPQFPPEAFEQGWEKLRNKGASHRELEIVCKDGSKIPTDAHVYLVRYGGKEFSCTFLRDITARKAREAELREQVAENERLRRQVEQENIILKEEIQLGHSFSNIISKSKTYKNVLRQVEQVAETEATVLLLGETGTGKELFAKAIHQLSRRSNRPMVKINCGALPENLIESELFGHEKGSFTGAFAQKTGRFELADGATLFLDEIGELPLDLQVKLLRVLQEGEFQRIGSNETLKVNVRVIAATNRDLEEQVRKGEFRQDLFYRLNVFPIYNIPLRDRAEDIPLLVRHFVEKFNQKTGKHVTEIPQHLYKELMQYDFPGNVRELENIIERGIILSNGKTLHLDFAFKKAATADNTIFRNMEEMQRDYILEALRRAAGKISGDGGAAELLDMNDKTLTSRMQKLGIKRTDYMKG